jgi:glucose-1-phosphate cytidylyltransferase
MKAVILAGGLGTRLSEETSIRPKPMVEIGGLPVLWHIMKIYSSYGINEFIICLGYRGYFIKEYFSNYFLHMSDVTYDMKNNKMKVHKERAEPWKVTLIDTGDMTMTGGRIKRVYDYLKDEDFFCLTYGDGLADINIRESIDYAKEHNKHAMLTAAYSPGRFGALEISDGMVKSFTEKPKGDGARINGGFFVLKPTIFDYIENDSTIWEADPLSNLAKDNQLVSYPHDGFWQPMDTLRDKIYLDELWESNNAPWRVW